MVLDRLRRNLPPLYVVTLLTTGPELPAMYVGVAIGAARARIAEHQLGVTSHACNFLMHSPQGKVGLVVVKFQHPA